MARNDEWFKRYKEKLESLFNHFPLDDKKQTDVATKAFHKFIFQTKAIGFKHVSKVVRNLVNIVLNTNKVERKSFDLMLAEWIFAGDVDARIITVLFDEFTRMPQPYNCFAHKGCLELLISISKIMPSIAVDFESRTLDFVTTKGIQSDPETFGHILQLLMNGMPSDACYSARCDNDRPVVVKVIDVFKKMFFSQYSSSFKQVTAHLISFIYRMCKDPGSQCKSLWNELFILLVERTQLLKKGSGNETYIAEAGYLMPRIAFDCTTKMPIVCKAEICCNNNSGQSKQAVEDEQICTYQFVTLLNTMLDPPDKRCANQHLKNASVITMLHFMLLSSELCSKNMAFLWDFYLRTNDSAMKRKIIIGWASILYRYSNVEQWTPQFYESLLEKDVTVRFTAITAIAHLILAQKIRFDGFLPQLIDCIVDENLEVQRVARGLLYHLATKESIFWNALDVRRCLKTSDEQRSRIIVEYIVDLIQCDYQKELMVTKLCMYLRSDSFEHHRPSMEYFLSLLNYTEKTTGKIEN